MTSKAKTSAKPLKKLESYRLVSQYLEDNCITHTLERRNHVIRLTLGGTYKPNHCNVLY